MLEGRIIKAEIDEEGKKLLNVDACIRLTCLFREVPNSEQANEKEKEENAE